MQNKLTIAGVSLLLSACSVCAAAPDSHTSAPDSHTLAPDSHSSASDSHTSAPDSHTSAPDSHTSAPNSHSSASDSHTLAPDSHTSAPDSHLFVPAGTFHGEVEGPDTDKTGNLFAVNFGGAGDEHKGSIGKVTPDGTASLLLRLPAGSTGNGIQIDGQGVMWIADYTGHHIWRYANGTLSSFVHEPRMHQPNDLALTKAGVIFASDPDWKNNRGQLWRISADGKAQPIDQTGTSNGVEVSPDQRWLYVNESAQRKVWVYPLNDQLEVGSKKLLIAFADFGLDGMRCDSKGNLYIARYGKGTVVKLSPTGAVLKEFSLHGQYPTNVALSPDERWLYVTMQRDGSIERIALQ